MLDHVRYLFYSHDGLGLGHARRNLAVAAALIDEAPEASVLLATSVDEIDRLGLPPNVDVLKLPGVRKLGNERYAARRLPVSHEEIGGLRAALLAAAVEQFRPGVMLVDKHPQGVGGELLPALEILRSAGGRAVLGLRDVLDDRSAVLGEWSANGAAGLISSYYERVLVYGDSVVLDPAEEYAFPPAVAERTHLCGYVVTRGLDVSDRETTREATPGPARPRVLATAGGGEDGFKLLSTFVEAASGAGWEAFVVAGPQAREPERRKLRDLAQKAGVAFRRFVPNLADWFPLADALVCMGGYNTLVEAVSSGTPTVCVPRVEPRSEQHIRATAFARLGLVRVVEPDQLDAARLRTEVQTTLRSSRRHLAERAHSALDFGGARRAAGHLLETALQPSELATAETR